MDFSAAINKLLFKRYVKFSTFEFKKVVRWHEWGEVENVHIEYNSSHFLIYLPKIIKIDRKLTKFWQKEFCTVFFLRHDV